MSSWETMLASGERVLKTFEIIVDSLVNLF